MILIVYQCVIKDSTCKSYVEYIINDVAFKIAPLVVVCILGFGGSQFLEVIESNYSRYDIDQI